MTLGLEKRVEVPERALDPSIGGHLIEAHREENLTELCPILEQWVQVTALGHLTHSVDVRLFERRSLPGARSQHFCGKLSL